MLASAAHFIYSFSLTRRHLWRSNAGPCCSNKVL